MLYFSLNYLKLKIMIQQLMLMKLKSLIVVENEDSQNYFFCFLKFIREFKINNPTRKNVTKYEKKIYQKNIFIINYLI